MYAKPLLHKQPQNESKLFSQNGAKTLNRLPQKEIYTIQHIPGVIPLHHSPLYHINYICKMWLMKMIERIL